MGQREPALRARRAGARQGQVALGDGAVAAEHGERGGDAILGAKVGIGDGDLDRRARQADRDFKPSVRPAPHGARDADGGGCARGAERVGIGDRDLVAARQREGTLPAPRAEHGGQRRRVAAGRGAGEWHLARVARQVGRTDMDGDDRPGRIVRVIERDGQPVARAHLAVRPLAREGERARRAAPHHDARRADGGPAARIDGIVVAQRHRVAREDGQGGGQSGGRRVPRRGGGERSGERAAAPPGIEAHHAQVGRHGVRCRARRAALHSDVEMGPPGEVGILDPQHQRRTDGGTGSRELRHAVRARAQRGEGTHRSGRAVGPVGVAHQPLDRIARGDAQHAPHALPRHSLGRNARCGRVVGGKLEAAWGAKGRDARHDGGEAARLARTAQEDRHVGSVREIVVLDPDADRRAGRGGVEREMGRVAARERERGERLPLAPEDQPVARDGMDDAVGRIGIGRAAVAGDGRGGMGREDAVRIAHERDALGLDHAVVRADALQHRRGGVLHGRIGEGDRDHSADAGDLHPRPDLAAAVQSQRGGAVGRAAVRREPVGVAQRDRVVRGGVDRIGRGVRHPFDRAVRALASLGGQRAAEGSRRRVRGRREPHHLHLARHGAGRGAPEPALDQHVEMGPAGEVRVADGDDQRRAGLADVHAKRGRAVMAGRRGGGRDEGQRREQAGDQGRERSGRPRPRIRTRPRRPARPHRPFPPPPRCRKRPRDGVDDPLRIGLARRWLTESYDRQGPGKLARGRPAQA